MAWPHLLLDEGIKVWHLHMVTYSHPQKFDEITHLLSYLAFSWNVASLFFVCMRACAAVCVCLCMTYHVRLNYFSSAFQRTKCFLLTTNPHKHQHKPNFTETNRAIFKDVNSGLIYFQRKRTLILFEPWILTSSWLLISGVI